MANRGNPAQGITVDLEVAVSYPAPIVRDVSPDGWHVLETPDIDIYGSGFFAGTRVFLDGAELTVKTMELEHIQAVTTSGLTGGIHRITVTGPGGDSAESTVKLTAPIYTVVAYKSMATIAAGGTGACFFTIEANDGFEGSVAFHLEDVPQDWTALLDRQTLGDGEQATVTVSVPAGASAGTSTLNAVSADGVTLPLDITVTDAESAPPISALSAQTGFAGDPITIYGSGFSTTATAFLGTVPMTVTERGTDLLTVLVPEGILTGDVTVTRDALVSNGVPFYVKSLSFTIYPDASKLAMQPGESRDVNLYVAGLAKDVALSTSTAAEGVGVSLSRAGVVPNGSLVLTVALSATVVNGSYPVTIRGTCGTLTNTVTVLVTVGEAFEITTTALPGAMEGVQYTGSVKTANGSAPVKVSLESGRLPYGLSLKEDGTIQGRPTETGTSRFTVKAEDYEGRSRMQALSITVTENAWSQDEKDGGRSRYIPVPSPADGRTQWTSSAYADARAILTGHGRVFLLTAEGVIGLDKETGRLLYRTSGYYTQWAYAGGTLFLLTGSGSFQARDGLTGNLNWSREGAKGFTTDGATIVLTSATAGLQVLDAATGALEAESDAVIGSGDILLWQNGTLLDAHGNTLSGLVNGEWQTVYDGQDGDIVDAASDTESVFLLTASGKLISLNDEWATTASVGTGFTSGQIALGETLIEVASVNGIRAYRRSDLTPLFVSAVQATEVAAAAEKVFAVNSDGLYALNGYDGTLIWKESGAFLDVALAGENAFVLTSEGRVKRYNAPDNINPPITGIGLAPDAPDGDNGYCIISPTVTLSAHDPETYVQETQYRYGDLSYALYQAPFSLPDGLMGLSAYSTDSKGYREDGKTISLRIDTVAPVTQLTASGTLGLSDYHTTSVTLSLEATDAGSGVKESE